MLSILQADVDAEGLNSDFDLNSLIEGDVDDEVQCWVRACVHRQSVREARGSCSN